MIVLLLNNPKKKAQSIIKKIEKGTASETNLIDLSEILDKEPSLSSEITAPPKFIEDRINNISAPDPGGLLSTEKKDKSKENIKEGKEGKPVGTAFSNTIKELSQLDGAFVISGDGLVEAACRFLTADASRVNISVLGQSIFQWQL